MHPRDQTNQRAAAKAPPVTTDAGHGSQWVSAMRQMQPQAPGMASGTIGKEQLLLNRAGEQQWQQHEQLSW